MTERLPEPPPPRSVHEPVGGERSLERRNLILGLGLFAFSLLIFGATIAIAYVYLALD